MDAHRALFPASAFAALAAIWAPPASSSLAAGGSAGERPDPRFGVMTHFAQGWDLSWASAIAPLGNVRDELYWDTVEPSPGRFTWPAREESAMAALRRGRLSPLIVLDFENHNYDGGLTPFTDAGIAAYARYGVEVLRHYGSQIQAVEIWNEYNGSFCHGPATRDRPAAYLRMLREAYRRIKLERPDVTVVGGDTSGVPLPYWRRLLAAGGLASMDALSVHPYRYTSPPEGIETDIAGLRELVRSCNGGRDKPIWVTEIGWYTKPSLAPGDPAIDEKTQANYLVRAWALLLSAKVERIYWYLLHDDQGLTLGLYRDGPRRAPKPADRALATLMAELASASFVARDKTPADLYSLKFVRAPGEEIRVIWALRPMALALRGATRATDLLGRPIPLSSSGALLATDSPIFVAGPVRDLPPPPAVGRILADSVRDFSSRQGGGGWTYGTFSGGGANLQPLPSFQTTDWTESWTGSYPSLSLTATDQHPSALNSAPVSAVRRWRSTFGGAVEIAGQFRCESTQGDGVGVTVLVDRHPVFQREIGGGRAIAASFDLAQTVRPGTTIDFAVDPGPRGKINYDATAVAATIQTPPP